MVDNGEFVIQDPALKKDIDLTQEWEVCFFPGQRVEMSMIFRHTGAVKDTLGCPVCGSRSSQPSGIETLW